MKLRTIMKGGGVFTQQSVRLSNFQIKIRFAGTCSWKRGNWLRLGSLVTFFGLGFHFMICTTLTKKCVYWWQRCTYDVCTSTSICTTTYILNSDLCGQKFSQKDRDLLLCKKDFHHHCCRRVMSSQKGLIFCARLVLWPQKGKQDVNRGILNVIPQRYTNFDNFTNWKVLWKQ